MKTIASASQDRIISEPPIGAANGNSREVEKRARRQIPAEQDRAGRQRETADQQRGRALADARVRAQPEQCGGVQKQEHRRRLGEFAAPVMGRQSREGDPAGAHKGGERGEGMRGARHGGLRRSMLQRAITPILALMSTRRAREFLTRRNIRGTLHNRWPRAVQPNVGGDGWFGPSRPPDKTPKNKECIPLRKRASRSSTILASLRRALAATRGDFPGEAALPFSPPESRAVIADDRAQAPQIAQPSALTPASEAFVEENGMVRLTKRSLRMAASTARAGADAAVTIAARTQNLLIPNLDGSAAQAHEARRMVEEKVAAAYEGAFAAQVAWGTFLVSAAFGGVRTAEDVTLGLADIAEAAVAPAHRTVRANALRLTGG